MLAKITKEKRIRKDAEVAEALRWLGEKSTAHDRENLVRFGIAAKNAFGVSMANIQIAAKRIGKNHEVAAALWESGCYEARMMAAYVDEPTKVSSTQMDRWCRDFDNWGIADTVCFVLFDRTTHAWEKVAKWSVAREEFVKRAAFALLWGLTVHDKRSGDELFVEGLELVEKAAEDERHFVKKAVNMALRATGKRNVALNGAAVAVARRLAKSMNVSARWVGKDALRELTSTAVLGRLAGKA